MKKAFQNKLHSSADQNHSRLFEFARFCKLQNVLKKNFISIQARKGLISWGLVTGCIFLSTGRWAYTKGRGGGGGAGWGLLSIFLRYFRLLFFWCWSREAQCSSLTAHYKSLRKNWIVYNSTLRVCYTFYSSFYIADLYSRIIKGFPPAGAVKYDSELNLHWK